MTLEKAYLMRKQECLSLQRENRKLTDTIDQLRKGSYTDPEKISHIKQISTLTRKLTEKDKIIGRYKNLYEKEQENSYSL